MNFKCIQKQQGQIGNNIVLKNAKQRENCSKISAIDLRSRYYFSIYITMSYLSSNLNTLFFLCTIIVFVVCNSLGNHHISVSIFLEESNSDVQEIVLNAFDRYSYDHKNISLKNQVHLNFSFVRYNRMVSNILSLEQDHSTSLRFAIFLHVSSHEMVLSSIMKRLNIVPIGLFQTDGILTTQVRLNYLTVFFFNPIRLPP